MEKLVYLIWSDREAATLKSDLSQRLALLPSAQGIQINLPDPAFEGGQEAIRNLLPRFDGLLSLWLPSRLDRHPLEAALSECVDGYHGYAVCESEPMHGALPSPDDSGRIPVLSQLCLLRKADDMGYLDWLHTWMDSHTEIAIQCQSTVSYTQNVVQAVLTQDAPLIHGVVEECFPPAAYADLGLFFGAKDDAVLLKKNITRLLESTSRFIPSDGLDRIFTTPHKIASHRLHASVAK